MKNVLLVIALGIATALPICSYASDEDIAPVAPAAEAPELGAERIYDLKNLTKIPVIIRTVRPNYPKDLRKAGVTGKAVIGFVITKEGRVVDLSFVSTTNLEFAISAMECVSRWLYKPGEINGVPVNARATVPITFKLNP